MASPFSGQITHIFPQTARIITFCEFFIVMVQHQTLMWKMSAIRTPKATTLRCLGPDRRISPSLDLLLRAIAPLHLNTCRQVRVNPKAAATSANRAKEAPAAACQGAEATETVIVVLGAPAVQAPQVAAITAAAVAQAAVVGQRSLIPTRQRKQTAPALHHIPPCATLAPHALPRPLRSPSCATGVVMASVTDPTCVLVRTVGTARRTVAPARTHRP